MKFVRVIKASKETYRVVEQDNKFYLLDEYDNTYKDDNGKPVVYTSESDAEDQRDYLNYDSYGKTSEALDDVIDNFEKITGVEFNKLFNKADEGESIFNEDTVYKTSDTIIKYVYNKYNIDSEDFLYELDDKLSNLYPY